MEIIFFPDRGSNPVRWTQSPTPYRVAIKTGLYRKAVQCIIYLYPVTFSPSNLKFAPEFPGVRELREMRGWAPNVTGGKMEITFFPDRGSNPVRWTQSPTLYCIAIKACLYREAVQVYHILLPGYTYISPCKICGPMGGAIFGPRAIA